RSALSPRVDSEEAPSFFQFIGLRSAWGSCTHLFCANYINYFLLTWLPYYLTRELHYSLETMAKIGGAAYLICGCSAISSGWRSDWLICAGYTPTVIRKAFAGATLGIAGVLIGFCAIAGP